MIDQSNKIEQLERRINELERRLEKTTSMDDVNRETEKRLSTYESNLRSDRGEVVLKKNFVVKNRKGIQDARRSPGVNPNKDNVVTMFFNERNTGRLNHIFIGDSALEGGSYNNSVLSGTTIHRDDISATNQNNGRVQFLLVRDKDVGADGSLSGGLENTPNISIFAQEIDGGGGEGDSVNILAKRDRGEASLCHLDETTGNYYRLFASKTGVFKESGNAITGTKTTTPL